MSNLLEKASIITTPTAYENGQLLSVKPNVNENLLSYSEDFSTFTGMVSVIDNFGLAPNGTQTAAKITFGGIYQTIQHNVYFDSGTYTLSCYIKNIDGNSELTIAGNHANYRKSITITNEWARYEATFTHNGTNDIQWILQDRNTSGWGSCLIWGAQIVKGSKVGTYTKTEGTPIPRADFFFERGSSATRVNSQGLIEDVQIIGSDLVQNGDFSQEGSELVTNGDFSTDTNWVKGNGWTIANGKATCTNGNANLAIRTGSLSITNGKIYKVQFTVLDYSSGNISVYLGNNGVSDSFLGGFNSNGTYTVHHRLTNSVANYLIFRNGTSGSNYSIDNVSVKEVGQNWSLASNWSVSSNGIYSDGTNGVAEQSLPITSGNKYRVKFDVIQQSTAGHLRMRLGSHPNMFEFIAVNRTVGTYATDTVAAGSAKINLEAQNGYNGAIGNISVKEITDDTDLPRIDYTDGVGSILLEPQSTNLVTYSEDFTQWTLGSNSTLALDNSVTAPDGSTGVYRLTLPATGSTFINSNTFSSITGTLSIYVKSAGTVNNDFNLYGGFGVASPLKTATSEWQRFTFENILCSGFYIVNSGDTFISDIYIWGAQLEQQSFPTSYIPTSGSTVTRLGETLTNSGNADLFNDSEGVLYAEVSVNVSGGHRQITISDGNTSNRVMINTMGGNNNTIRGQVRISGATPFQFDFNSGDITQFHKVAIKYKQNDFAMWVDGVEVATDTSGNTPVGLDILNFNQAYTGSDFYGKTKCVAVFKEALSNDELECLTGEGYESFSALAQAFNYTII